MASKNCPMCGTSNSQGAPSCKYCGYLFEDFGNQEIMTKSGDAHLTTPRQAEQEPANTDNTQPDPSAKSFEMQSSFGVPLFSVSRPLLGTIVPSLVYLIFVLLLIPMNGFSVLSFGYIAIFVLIIVIPVFFSPRRYEFYDSSLRIHKIIGGDSEVPYSRLMVYDNPIRRKQRIILSQEGQRRPIVIPKNPTNKELGMDLRQFLSEKLKNYDSQLGKPRPTEPTSNSDGSATEEDASEEFKA